MKKLILSLSLACGLAFGQAAPPTTAQTFDAAYVASKDQRIQALFACTLGLPCGPTQLALDPMTRFNRAGQLAQVLVVDEQIDSLGGDPYLIMLERQQYGYTAVGAIGQFVPFSTPPGVSAPGIPAYDPTGLAIKVSTSLADYPPFPVPVLQATAAAPYVGSYAGNGFYFASQAAQSTFANGQQYSQAGVTYVFVVGNMGPFGKTYFWQKAN